MSLLYCSGDEGKPLPRDIAIRKLLQVRHLTETLSQKDLDTGQVIQRKVKREIWDGMGDRKKCGVGAAALWRGDGKPSGLDFVPIFLPDLSNNTSSIYYRSTSIASSSGYLYVLPSDEQGLPHAFLLRASLSRLSTA